MLGVDTNPTLAKLRDVAISPELLVANVHREDGSALVAAAATESEDLW